MFTQLAPLIRERPVMLTILAGAADGEEIRLVITPQRIKDDDPPPKLDNLAVTGTPEELDLELPEALASWVRNRKTLVDQIDEAKKAAVANAEAAKKTTVASTNTSTPSRVTGKTTGVPQGANATKPDTVDDLMDAFGKTGQKKNEAPMRADAAPTTPATPNAPASASTSGRLDLEDVSSPGEVNRVDQAGDDDEGGWE